MAAGGCSSCFIDQSVLWNAQASDGKLRPAMHKHHLSPEKANEGNLNGCSKPRVAMFTLHALHYIKAKLALLKTFAAHE